MNKNTLTLIFLCLAVYFLSTGAFYLFFSQGVIPGKKATPVALPTVGEDGELTFDEKLPKTEPCPLNGAKYSKQQRKWWESHRPLGVMMENHEEARPQSGLSSADVIYEAVAEGGITRFLTVFYCQPAQFVGPVRSARTYFLDFISEYGQSPLYAHVGGANTPGPANALGQIEEYGWASHNDLNQFSIGFPTFWRDYDRIGHTVATEHTMYSTPQKLWDFAKEKRKLSVKDKDGVSWDKGFVSYSFKEDAVVADRGATQTVHLEYWSSDANYFVDWLFDKATNSYKRSNGGKPHTDLNNEKQLTAKTIVVLSMIESRANDGYEGNLHMLYKTKGTGKATLFMDGQEIKGTWKKDGRTGRTIISDAKGVPVKFNRGLIWFHILPTDGELVVK